MATAKKLSSIITATSITTSYSNKDAFRNLRDCKNARSRI